MDSDMKRRSFFGLIGAAVAGATGVKAAEEVVIEAAPEASVPIYVSDPQRVCVVSCAGPFQYYTGYEPLNISLEDVLTSQEFDWSH